MSKKKHKCSWQAIEWQKDFRIAGLGETVERTGFCECGRSFREVYLGSCVLDNKTDEEVFLD